MSQNNKDIESLAEQLNNIKNQDDMKSFVKFKDDYSVISQALNSNEFKVKNFSHIMSVLLNLKKLDIKITINIDLCNKLFNNDKAMLYSQISLSNLKLICDFCEDEAISNEVAKKLFRAGVNLNNKKFFDEVSISEIYSMKKKFSVEAQEVVKNNLDNNRKNLLDEVVLKKPKAYDEQFSKFVFKLYCFQIYFCGSLDLDDTRAFMKLIPSDIINTFVLTTYFENDIDNKNASPKKDDFSVEDKNLLKKLFSNSALELATEILITHKKNENKLNLDELKIIILARYGFKNDEEFKSKVKDLSKNEIDDNFWLNNFEAMIPSEMDHMCYSVWLAKFLSKDKSKNQPDKFLWCPFDIFQLFKFRLANEKNCKISFDNNLTKTFDLLTNRGYKMATPNGSYLSDNLKDLNLDEETINKINANQSERKYIFLHTCYTKKENGCVLFVFENDKLVEVYYSDSGKTIENKTVTTKNDMNNIKSIEVYYSNSGKTIENKAVTTKNDTNNIINNDFNLTDKKNQTQLPQVNVKEQNKMDMSNDVNNEISNVNDTGEYKNNITESVNKIEQKENTNDIIEDNRNSKIKIKKQNENNIIRSDNLVNHNNFVNNDSDPTNTKNQMELSKIIEVKEQNKNNINKSNDQINYKKLKIAFVILGAVSIISITFLFINIFYFELAVFHFLNILLIALFVLSVVPIVALSIAIKNINILPENFCLRNLLEYLISPRLEKTKSMDQNLKIDLQMQNQQIKS